MTVASVGMQVLPEEVWRPRAEAHARAVEQLTADRLARRVEGRTHPVDDFLWEYYNFRPAQLARWHPGAGTGLAEGHEREGWSGYLLDEGARHTSTWRGSCNAAAAPSASCATC